MKKLYFKVRVFGALAFGRFKIKEFVLKEPYILATVEILSDEVIIILVQYQLNFR